MNVSSTSQPARQRMSALYAGLASCIMFAAAIFAEMGMRQQLVHPDNVLLTQQSLQAHSSYFLTGYAAYWIIVGCDLVVTLAFFRYFLPVNRKHALLAALFRGVYTLIFAVALFFFYTGYAQSSSGGNFMQWFDLYDSWWSFGLVLFGIHLWFIAKLTCASGFIPKWIAGMITCAAIAYFTDNIFHLLVPDYDAYRSWMMPFVAIPSICGEMGLAVWLLLRGGKKELTAAQKRF